MFLEFHCLVCLKTDTNLQLLMSVDDKCTSFYDKLEFLTCDVERNEGFPDSVCGSCSTKLDIAYDFMQLCAKSKGFLTEYRNKLTSILNEKENQELLMKLLKIEVLNHCSQISSTVADCSQESDEDINHSDSCDPQSDSHHMDQQNTDSLLVDPHDVETTEFYHEDFINDDSNIHREIIIKTDEDVETEETISSALEVVLPESDDEKSYSNDDVMYTEKKDACSDEDKATDCYKTEIIYREVTETDEHIVAVAEDFEYFVKNDYQEVMQLDEHATAVSTLLNCKKDVVVEQQQCLEPAFVSCAVPKRGRPRGTGHQRNSKSVRPHECSVCNKTFIRKQSLQVHMSTHAPIKPFKCELCELRFNYQTSLKSHMRKHTGERPYQCEECGKSFALRCSMARHRESHTRGKQYRCHVCGKLLSTKVTLKEHLFKHVGQKDFECNLCGLRFWKRTRLDQHMHIHSGQKPFECQQCGKMFATKNYLKKHLFMHTGQKPFECGECGCCYAEQQKLKRHIAKHTGELPFACATCGKRFCLRSELNTHTKIHTGIMPFNCHACDKKFLRASTLKYHVMMVHTKEKPIGCQLCDQRFYFKFHLNRHMKVHENYVEPADIKAEMIPDAS